jgi:hypothetical protein
MSIDKIEIILDGYEALVARCSGMVPDRGEALISAVRGMVRDRGEALASAVGGVVRDRVEALASAVGGMARDRGEALVSAVLRLPGPGGPRPPSRARARAGLETRRCDQLRFVLPS